MALMNVIEEISTCLDDKKSSIGICLDVTKAFDTIDDKILFTKLHHHSIRVRLASQLFNQ